MAYKEEITSSNRFLLFTMFVCHVRCFKSNCDVFVNKKDESQGEFTKEVLKLQSEGDAVVSVSRFYFDLLRGTFDPTIVLNMVVLFKGV